MVIIPDKPGIDTLFSGWYSPYVQRIDMMRLDALHAEVSGNKWFKLKHNIGYALDNGYTSLLTFGGGYSNHLAATAAAAKAFGLKSIGIIRGVYPILTPTLLQCADNGMQLHFVSQQEYTRKEDAIYLNELSIQFKHPYIIPEGGANEYGRVGVEEIAGFIDKEYTHICVSVGTGTTMAGICNGLNTHQSIYGYAPMKGGNYLADEIQKLIRQDNTTPWQLFDNWHFGGFGKYNDELIAFMNLFFEQHHISLDMVYTAKMMYGLQEQLKTRVFLEDAVILCVHTGGLQGNAAIESRLIY